MTLFETLQALRRQAGRAVTLLLGSEESYQLYIRRRYESEAERFRAGWDDPRSSELFDSGQSPYAGNVDTHYIEPTYHAGWDDPRKTEAYQTWLREHRTDEVSRAAPVLCEQGTICPACDAPLKVEVRLVDDRPDRELREFECHPGPGGCVCGQGEQPKHEERISDALRHAPVGSATHGHQPDRPPITSEAVGAGT